MTEFLEIALRAYTEPVDYGRKVESAEEQEKRVRRLLRYRHRDNHRPVLIPDFETRTDPSQRPMFGAYRFYRWKGNSLVCLLEGLIYADDLTKRELQIIRDHWQHHKLTTGADQQVSDSAPALWLTSERQFVRMIYRACFEPGAARAAALGGLNLNFDVSRLAMSWGESDTNKYINGFTLALHEGYTNADGEHRDSPHHPRYGTKHLSSTKSLKGWIAKFAGHMIDVRTLAFALTNSGYSLESGCKAFKVSYHDVLGDEGCERREIPREKWNDPYEKQEAEHGKITPEYIDYCRDDVAATAKLYEQVIREYDRHPIPLQASQAYSPASIGKAYLAGMRIRPRLECQPDFPREQLGIAMSAFYGGRTEARIVRVPVPVVYCDLMSAYTTGNSLMNLWRFVTAERIELVNATAEVRRLVERIDLDNCLTPETWRNFPALVQIKPSDDAVLPVRGRYQKDAWNIGSSYLSSDEPLWYALPDVIASKLITGRAPEIVRALRLVPVGVQPGLKPIKLRGEVAADPHENFFRAVVEQRHELQDKKSDLGQFLKTLANAASYGIYAEMIRSELPGRKTERVSVYDHTGRRYELEERNPERPGRYVFSPLAALITAGTRLLLAITERLVSDAGGSWAMMDTDSIAIVSTEHGGFVECPGGPVLGEDGRQCVRALSWAQDDEIRERMRPLNPYRGKAGAKSILELEDENFESDPSKPGGVDRDRPRQLYCYAISSKRYSLYNLSESGKPELRTATEPPGQHAEEEARTPTVRKRSDHGLGYLINPLGPDSTDRDWILQGWEWIVREALGLDAPEPSWFDKPALMRHAVTTPGLLDCFEKCNDGKPRRRQVRPFNFFMVAQEKQFAHDRTGELHISPITGQCALIAPYESNPERWERLEWTNRYEPGSSYRITTNPGKLGTADELLAVRTLRDIFYAYRDSPELKSLGPDGQPAGPGTRGLLSRRHVKVASITSIGKEMNALEEQLAGIRQTKDERVNTYRRPGEDSLWRLTRDVLLTIGEPVERTARGAKVGVRTVERARAGDPVGPRAQEKLTRYAKGKARAALRAVGLAENPRAMSAEALLMTYLEHFKRLCEWCAVAKARPGSKYCSDNHRKEASRARL